MTLDASKVKGGKTWVTEVLEPGPYAARLVSVVDMGIQPQQPYQGEEKEPAAEIRIVYELSDEFLKDEDGKDMPEKPLWQDERIAMYPLSSEKAKSTMRYLALDPEMKHKGNWADLLGSPVMLNITQYKTKKGDLRNKIKDTNRMTTKQAAKAPELVNEPFFLDLDNPDMKAWERLPEWNRDLIRKALNFNDTKLADLVGKQVVEDEVGGAKVAQGSEEW